MDTLSIEYATYINGHEDLHCLLLDDPETDYKIYRIVKSKKCSFLHKLVLKTNKHPILVECLKEFLKTSSGTELLDIQNDKGFTALMLASWNSNTDSTEETVKILVDAKANLDLQNKNDWTALMMACRFSNTDSTEGTVKILVDAKANLDLQNKDGWTALMFACINPNTDSTEGTVKILVDAYANLDLQNKTGWTALMLACRYSNTYSTEGTVKILVDAKANLDLQVRDGRTALMFACRYSYTDSTEGTVKILVDAKANLDLQNNENKNALMFYLHNASIDGLEYFLDNHKNINDMQIYNYVKNNSIPLHIYDYLVDKKIIKSCNILLYSKSKHNIQVPCGIIQNYNIQISECIICNDTVKTIECNYGHTTCIKCLNGTKYVCQGCQQLL